jgi:hypothetical protein
MKITRMQMILILSVSLNICAALAFYKIQDQAIGDKRINALILLENQVELERVMRVDPSTQVSSFLPVNPHSAAYRIYCEAYKGSEAYNKADCGKRVL